MTKTAKAKPAKTAKGAKKPRSKKTKATAEAADTAAAAPVADDLGLTKGAEAPAKPATAAAPPTKAPTVLDQMHEKIVKKGTEKVEPNGPPAPAADKQALNILADSITKMFADRAKTNLPRISEKDVMHFARHAVKGVGMEFEYADDEKTQGKITLSEFNNKVTIPAEGHFEFNKINN